MSRRPPPPTDEIATAARGQLRLSRRITATWWYTISALVFFEFMLVGLWTLSLIGTAAGGLNIAIIGIGGLVWCGATFALMQDYRHHTDGAPIVRRTQVLVPLAIAVVFGVIAGIVTGVWIIAVLPLLQCVSLLNWPPGVRLRVLGAVTLVLVCLCIVDTRVLWADARMPADWWILSFYTVLLPSMSVVSLWWWDVLVTLDRARVSEARLAATQERLRLATDVHDLQGHHLQVIALQLELAERLMTRDPDAALEQLRASRASVDEARAGTRDIALRFRTAALADEIANAVDLLRAAGTTADARIDPGSVDAPQDVFGPVIRETTTNVLRHGGGKWARLSLMRLPEGWQYEIANDRGGAPSAIGGGTGLVGMRERAKQAGGTLDVREDRQEFSVTVFVPVEVAGFA